MGRLIHGFSFKKGGQTFWDDDASLYSRLLNFTDLRGFHDVRKVRRITNNNGAVPIHHYKRVSSDMAPEIRGQTFIGHSRRRDDNVCLVLILKPLPKDIHV